MIRILHILGNLAPGGMGNFLMNIYRRIDRDKVQFDFMVMGEKENNYHAEAAELGARIFKITRMSENPLQYYRDIRDIIKREGYEIVFRQTDTATVAIDLLAARVAGAKHIIPHSHSTAAVHPVLHRLFRPFLVLWSTERYACSGPTGKWMYGRASFEIIRNAIDLEDFSRRPEAAERLSELRRCSGPVFGHVGNFWYPKNHMFLLDIFAEIVKLEPEACFILVGAGELLEAVKEKAEALGLSDKIVFTGSRLDVSDILQVMDCLIFPSIYEGFPIALVEAQGTGLPCIISDNITEEVSVTNLVHRLSLEDSAGTWAKAAVTAASENREKGRRSRGGDLKAAGYDIAGLVKHYENFDKT